VVEYPLVVLLASYLRPAFRQTRGQLLGLRLGAKRAGVGTGKVENGNGVGGKVGDEGGAVEDESVVVDEPRAKLLDLLLPLCIGALAAVLALVAPHVGANTDEHVAVVRVAVSLGVPLFLLNHFFAPRPLRFALGLGAVMAARALLPQSSGGASSASRNFFGTLR